MGFFYLTYNSLFGIIRDNYKIYWRWSLDAYSKKVARCDVMIDRWSKKRSEVIADYQEKISNMKKMISLWEEVAQETLQKRLDERQHILNLIAEHPCG